MPDPIAVVASILLPYWWVPLVLLLGSLCRTPVVKGWVGEMLLHVCLRLLLDRKRYRVFRNVTLPTADGSTQVDHIVVSVHGIVVIETKNYAGWIFGKPHDKMWTQKFPRRSIAFQNPLRQNHKHVRTLADLLALGDEVLFSLVVFVGSAEFKTAMPENVTTLGGCIGFIRRHGALLLSDAQAAAAAARIESGRLAPSLATQRAHVKHVRKRLAGKRPGAPVLQPVGTPAPPPVVPGCPLCGAALHEYTYKTGAKAGLSFQGCVRFPACTHRVDLAAPVPSDSSFYST